MTWWNAYVGIPYAEKGRARSGADCWGLVRLVHSEVFGHQLPSLVDDYATVSDRERLAEIVARECEGWQLVDGEARSGDVAVFRIFGEPSHVGVVTRPGMFLHVRQGHSAVIERLDSPQWRHRLEGLYRYTAEAVELVPVSACPHPLRTQRVDAAVPAGTTLRQVADWLRAGVSSELRHDAVLMLDGKPIPAELWDVVRTEPGQRLEYRAVARGDGVGRIIAMIAVLVIAWWAAPYIASAMLGVNGAAALGSAGVAAFTGVVQGALTVAGMMLVNKLFPVRQPSVPAAGQRQLLLQGASNAATPYAAIPVPLGRIRYTPPLGAQAYVESDATTSYLRMLLVWGYGPLQVSDLRIGGTPISTLEGVEIETLTGYHDSSDAQTRFRRLYGSDVTQTAVNLKLESDGTSAGSPWVERVIAGECDSIKVTLHFPEGLRQMPVEGGSAGKVDPASFRGQVQVRQLDSDTLAPVTDWGNIEQTIPAETVNLGTAWYNTDADDELEPVYRWTRLSLDEYGRLIVRIGAVSTSSSAGPSGALLTRLQQENFGVDASFDRLPAYGAGEEGLHDICVYGDTVFQVVDRRDASVTGCALSLSGLRATVGAGTVTRADDATIKLGASGEPYYKRKDAFAHNVTVNVARGRYEVRVRRTNSSESTFEYPSGNEGRRYHDCYLASVTGYLASRPVTPPKPMAMTALRIKATNQINGNVEGITGTVQVICKDWNHLTETWVLRATRNPASLFRYVLQHPGNAQAAADSAIDLTALADWHDYCRTNGFAYDNVLDQQRSLWDVLLDIAAAGRASPIRPDGKWAVVIDRPRTEIAQHFTPHNSWGFEGVRTLPKLPHAFRVRFINSQRGYQQDELIVYNDGYSAANATLFEGLELPGVSDPTIAYKHARFHFAQLKLRPETYTINADIEHIVCTRGDLVRVTHDVPMWGLGTGRIKERVDGTTLLLDEPVQLEAATQYTVRIRSADGSSIVRTVAAEAAGGEFDTITLTSSVTADEVAAGDLFMLGELSSESVELLVLGIEPAENLTARLTLVDYSPAVFDSDSEAVPAFDSQITLPPERLQRRIAAVPTIESLASDESVLQRLPSGGVITGLRATFTNPDTLPAGVGHVQAEIDFANDGAERWQDTVVVPLTTGSVTFYGVEEGASYRVRLRYVDDVGRTSEWAVSDPHTVVGKTTPPPYVTRFKLIEQPGGVRQFFWEMDDPPVDLFAYEVRYSLGTTIRAWDRMIPLFAKDWRASSHENMEPMGDGVYTFAIRAVDIGGLLSEEPHYITEVLDGDQFGAVLAIVLPHEEDWPGTKTDCYVSGTALVDIGTATWDDLDIAWDDTEITWGNTVASPIVYEHEVVDLGASVETTVRVNSLAAGTSLVEMRTSDDDVTYSAWGEVPSTPITTRYVQLRWTVSGAAPVLYRAQAIFYV